MQTRVQARLDEETAMALEKLERTLGLSASEIVRIGLRLMLQEHSPQKPRRILGQGEFDSGLTDLATNKRYLERIGQFSGLDADPRRKGKSKREESVA